MLKTKNAIKRVVSLMLAAVMFVALYGCSGGSSPSKSPASAAPSGGATSTSKKIVKAGTGNSMPPYCSLDADGKPVGYDVAVLNELNKRLTNYTIQIQSMDFNTLIVSIDSGALDIVSHQLVKSDVRKQKYLFPEQYYCLSPMSLVVKKDSGIKTMADLAGKSINMNPTSYEYSMLTAYNNAHPDGKIKINAVSDLSTADNFKQVSNGQVDASLSYQSTFESVQKQLNLANLQLTDVVMVEDTYIMISKTNADLCKEVDQALKDMLKDGTLAKISAQYLGQDIFSKYSGMISTTVKN